MLISAESGEVRSKKLIINASCLLDLKESFYCVLCDNFVQHSPAHHVTPSSKRQIESLSRYRHRNIPVGAIFCCKHLEAHSHDSTPSEDRMRKFESA